MSKEDKKRKKFPSFLWLILVVAVIWLLEDLGYINFNVPWLPLIVIILVSGAIINHYNK